MTKLIIKKCLKCGAIIKMLKECNCNDCGIVCCGNEMVEIIPNSVDASFEKHVPMYEIKNDKIVVNINHVMDNDHYIEWICFVTENGENYVYLEPNQDAIAIFKESKGILYSYCNKHGLWMNEIK